MYHRYSSLAASTLSLLFCLPTLQQPAAAQMAFTGPSSSTEVVYFVANASVTTYDVNRTNGIPTEEGTGVTLDSTQSTDIVPSANDHFIYDVGYNGAQYLWVYQTDATGVPQLPAIQTLSLADGTYSFSYFEINPNGTLAYGAEEARDSSGNFLGKIVKFTVNPTTGIVSSPSTVATFNPNGSCKSGADLNALVLYGFNPAGDTMYYSWYCSYHDGQAQTYFSRPVNQQTGALGSQKYLFSWNVGTLGTDLVNFTASAILDYKMEYPDLPGSNSLNVYSLNGGSRLFSCTKAMLEACGYGTWNVPDPSGKFDFIQLSPDITQEVQIDLTAKQVLDTPYYVDGSVVAFAPDDALIYTELNQMNPWIYPIYIFNPTTGAVTPGGEISIDSVFSQVVTALRK